MVGLLGLLCLTTGSARAASAPGYVYLSQTRYVAHENQGELAITINRTDDSVGEQIRYGVRHLDAINGVDMVTVPNSFVDMQPGQSSYTFDVKIIDRGITAGPVWAEAYIYGSDPLALGDATGRTYAHGPVSSKIEITRNDGLGQRDPLDLLGFDTLSASQSSLTQNLPLAEAPMWVAGHRSNAGVWARRVTHRHPAEARELDFLAGQPGVHRIYFWNTPAYPAHTVARFLESTENRHPDTVLQLSTYSLVHGHCGRDTSSPAFVKRYDKWIHGVAAGIGNFHVVMYLELDSLITTQCMADKPNRLHARLTELSDAVQALEALPHTAVYVDGGAADAVGWQRDARLLAQSDVKQAQGFFLNSTHFDWTTKEVAYGQRIAQRLGGVHFIVNTAENGQGPLAPHSRVEYGNEMLCNPAGRGLGPESVQTGYKYVDGFLWFTNPGGSAGNGPGCGKGAPPTAKFWAAYAAGLVHRANFSVTGPREHLLHDGTYVPLDAAVAPDRSHAALSHDNRN